MKFSIFKASILVLIYTYILGALISCANNDNITEFSTYTTSPGIALLSLPKDEHECEISEVIDGFALVTFRWNKSEATEHYDLTIINLVTQDIILKTELEGNTTIVELLRGYAYSWQITSKNSTDTVTTSEIWRFYVPNEGESNNTPFPATLLNPFAGATIIPQEGKVTLEWEGADSDDDDLTYSVFVDTVDGYQSIPSEWENISENSIGIFVVPYTLYYWHIETSDGINTSISQTYTFTTDIPEGTIASSSEEILDAISTAVSGETIYVRGGNYKFNSTIEINKSGASGDKISLLMYPGDTTRPKFDFSSMTENSFNRGMQLNGSYWYIKGIDVYGAGDNGMFIKGHNNIIEFCTFSENADTGLQIGNGGSNNTILNCDSFFNADSTLENADGFASKLDAGTGNKFIGCRAWQNLDDGWDGYLRGTDDITTTYENCWAFKNGILKNGTVGLGDGNGFKTGGSDDKLLKHNTVYTNCIAAGNVYDGFDHNSNRGDVTIYNCSLYSNGRNINFGSSNIANSLTIKNTISLSGKGNDSYKAITTNITNNSWQNNLVADSLDFVSINIDILSSVRKADGSLPDVDFMKLVSGSDLVNAGISIGLPYNGSAPDLGAFEH